jgi:hypothetical protein
MIPYKNPTSRFDVFGPATSMTPGIVSHGGGFPGTNGRRVLRGNPVGWMQHSDGKYYPYFSSLMEHSHQPVEHAMLSSVDVDHYGLGQVMPRDVEGEPQPSVVRPSANGMFVWPDASVSSAFRKHFVFGGEQHPGGDFPSGDAYADDDMSLGHGRMQSYRSVQKGGKR